MLTDAFNFSADDRAFIEKMNARFPHLITAFNEAATVPAHQRYGWARKRLETLLRAGYTRHGIPDDKTETVREHIDSSKGLASFWAPKDLDLNLILFMIEVHDIGEAIIGDFTPKDDITRAEKMRLERLAVDMIFEKTDQRLKEVWLAFEDKTCAEALAAHDIEKAQCLFKALEYEIKDRGFEGVFDDFWDNLETRWSSELGPKLHKHTKDARDRLRTTPR